MAMLRGSLSAEPLALRQVPHQVHTGLKCHGAVKAHRLQGTDAKASNKIIF